MEKLEIQPVMIDRVSDDGNLARQHQEDRGNMDHFHQWPMKKNRMSVKYSTKNMEVLENYERMNVIPQNEKVSHSVH